MIAIIAILAALLMPSLKSARESARAAQCMNRMKQLGTAAACYSSENADAIPGYARDDATTRPITGGTYEERIAPYLGSPKKQAGYNESMPWIAPMRCPSIPISNPDLSMSHQPNVACGRTWVLNGLFTTASSSTAVFPSKRMGEFRDPAQLLYCTDGLNIMYVAPYSGQNLPGQVEGYTLPPTKVGLQEWDSIFFPHKGMTTGLFLDGHAQMLRPTISTNWIVPPS